MSKDFYFNKWKVALHRLQELVDIDVNYQVIKAHDQTLPEAVYRLSAMLGKYMLVYNEVIECVQQNLQVQKAVAMNYVVQAIVLRILELKRELDKLEGSNFQFISRGLIEVLHTIWDIQLKEIPLEERRPKDVQTKLDKILAIAKEKMEQLAEDTKEESNSLDTSWDEEEDKEETVMYIQKDKLNVIQEEKRKRGEYVNMILAHEKTRQVTRAIKVSKLKRENWEKELTGTLQPIARYELRERSANLMHVVFRAYFKIKRERIRNCKRDEILGIIICKTPNTNNQRKIAEEMLQKRSKLHETYKNEWIQQQQDFKQEILDNYKAKFIEEFMEQIREWFMEWFESVQFFHDIPKDGSAAIFRGDVPNPYEWLEENKALLLQAEANKKKSPQDLKFEKMEAKTKEKMLKKEEQMKIKAEALLLKKMMKNPTMHPGFNYPQSKRTQYLQEVINNYHKTWDMYDVWETNDVKEKHVHKVTIEDAIMEAKYEVLPEADEIMWRELRQLKQSLKEDYENNEEEMPVNVTKPIRSAKKTKKVEVILSDRIAEIIQDLAVQGFIVEYPKTKIDDFIGDPNFGGEDLRAQILPAFPYNFEIGVFWWEICRNVGLGFHKILLVGPESSGKTLLVHALASKNDAVLFELDPYKVQDGQQSASFLKRLMLNVVTCVRTLQPVVIHIKFIEKLFYNKIPPEETKMNLPVIKSFLVQKLMKKIHKTDKVTVIGKTTHSTAIFNRLQNEGGSQFDRTCTEPWLAKSSALLKVFPSVLLLPNTTYSLVVQMLKEWVVRYEVIPADFNVSNLAYVLQGYSFGYLKKALETFMSADRIVKIAAFGLTVMEVYNYILDDDTQNKIEYDKYLNWYTEKTIAGKREMQHLQEQRDFKAAVEKYAAKKKKVSQAKSAPSSTTGSLTRL